MIANHTTLQTGIEAYGTIDIASAISWLSMEDILGEEKFLDHGKFEITYLHKMK